MNTYRVYIEESFITVYQIHARSATRVWSNDPLTKERRGEYLLDHLSDIKDWEDSNMQRRVFEVQAENIDQLFEKHIVEFL